MNRFERIARDRWTALAPAAAAALEDPSRHFSTLGDQAQTAWSTMVEQIELQPSQSTGLEEAARMARLRAQAEEVVIDEFCQPPATLIEADWAEEKADCGSPREALTRLYERDLATYLEAGASLQQMGVSPERACALTGLAPEDIARLTALTPPLESPPLALGDVLAMEPFLTVSVRWQRAHPQASLWAFWELPAQPVSWPPGYSDLLETLGLPADFPINPQAALRAA